MPKLSLKGKSAGQGNRGGGRVCGEREAGKAGRCDDCALDGKAGL